MIKKAKLGTKLTLIVVLITSLVLAAVLGYQALTGRTRDIANAYADARSLAEANAAFVKNELETALDTTRTLASALSAYERMPLEGRRETLSAVIRQVAEDNAFLLGAWACFEPNALDGRDAEFANTPGSDKSGRFIPSWVRGQSGATLSALVGYDVPGEGDYYQLALRSGEDTVLEPYAYETNGKSVLLTSFSVPIRNASGKVVGVTGIDISLDALNRLNLNKGAYKTASIGVLTNGGVYVAHPKPEAVGTPLSAHEDEAVRKPMMDAIHAGSIYIVEAFSDVTKEVTLKVLSPITLGNTGTPWSVMQSVLMSEVLEESNRNIVISVAALVVGLLVIVLAVAIAVKRIVTLPVRAATEKAGEFAVGDFSSSIPEAFMGRGDEVGDLARANDTLFRQMNDLLQNLKGAADQVGAGARQISDSSTALAQGATEQASSVEELSASMEQIAAQTQVNTENAKKANELSEQAKRDAEQGNEQMKRLLGAMD
ncbi:MAG: cache domain-containing protein, partial [Eubacteriales bacterium]|nr:cache domain-containing protein [Christensenellaceae bacterium]MEA5064481.1 cache domain-containing protein [Eubacteriales bacterium]